MESFYCAEVEKCTRVLIIQLRSNFKKNEKCRINPIYRIDHSFYRMRIDTSLFFVLAIEEYFKTFSLIKNHCCTDLLSPVFLILFFLSTFFSFPFLSFILIYLSLFKCYSYNNYFLGRKFNLNPCTIYHFFFFLN